MVPARVYSVGARTRWQAMSQSTCPWTVPGKEYTPPSQWSALVLLLIPLVKLGPVGFYSNNWGADPATERAVTTTEQREGPANHERHTFQEAAGIHTKPALVPKMLNPHRLHRYLCRADKYPSKTMVTASPKLME